MESKKNIKRSVIAKYVHSKYFGYLPMINIRLRHKGKQLPSVALIDSGATSTFIPLNLALVLKLELKNSDNNTSGAGGNFQSYHTEIEELDIMKEQALLTKFKKLPVYVFANKDSIPFVIVGRDSIFLKYDIKFQENKRQVQLQETSAYN